MTALVLRWRKPDPVFTTQWRGPDGSVTAALQADPLTPIASVIGPQGPRYLNPLEIVSAASITPELFTYDGVDISALAVDAVFNVPDGDPVNWMQLVVSVKDNGTQRQLTWNSVYATGSSALTLPSATVPGKITTLGFQYRTAIGKWLLLASITQP